MDPSADSSLGHSVLLKKLCSDIYLLLIFAKVHLKAYLCFKKLEPSQALKIGMDASDCV